MRGVFRFIAAIILAIVSLVTCYTTQENPVAGEKQRGNISVDQEIALGLQAAPQMAQQYGGLHPERLQDNVDREGDKVLQGVIHGKSPYQVDFHVLADEQIINGFSLPGGKVCITAVLLS